MKKLLLLPFFLMSINFRLFSQSDTLPWAPTGATWIYEIDSYQGKVPYIGFIYLSYVKDTLLLGKLVKKITVSDFRDIFMYNSNDSLYWLVENKYELLLVFSAEIGDSWTTKGRDETVFCKPFINSYDTITVRNISNKTFSNKDFEVIENRMSNCTWQLGPIIKNIGLSNFFEPIYFPKESCGYVTCQPLNINLACYYDMRRGIMPYLPGLAARHTVVLASVRDQRLEELAAMRGDAPAVYDAASAAQAIATRDRMTALVTRAGIEVIDATPDEIAPKLADRYLALKAAGRL